VTAELQLALDAFPAEAELAPLWEAAWGEPMRPGYTRVLDRSLCHAVARETTSQRLVGFVNVATDGGVHAFLLDTTVHPDFRRRGLATDLVRLVTTEAAHRGAHWLHVDYGVHLVGFYAACGFRPTAAGLIALGR
jgi:ribosomal protein S18 acetylase RimI-like enzyme